MPASSGVGQPPPENAPLVFEHLAQLAAGAETTVELCRIGSGPHRGQLAAVKRLRPVLAEDPEFVDMFRDEIWMAAALRHANVAQVLGWGQDAGGVYLAVEFVRGVSLQRLMRTVFATGEAFTERLIVHLCEQVCHGLSAAHELRSPDGEFLNLVHRNLTPGNILLGFDGQVKITDFGIAKAQQRVTRTAIGMTKGEPAYMSPEQVCGKPLDGRSDLFALGVVLYELFAQHRPWAVRSVQDALTHIVDGQHPPLLSRRPRMDGSLAVLVDRCLAKDSAARYPAARALAVDLSEWLQLHGYRDNRAALGRFVRRNSMRQMRWVDRALSGALSRTERQSSPFDRHRADTSAAGVPPPFDVEDAETVQSEPTQAIERRPVSVDQGATTKRRPGLVTTTTTNNLARPAQPSPMSSTAVTQRRAVSPVAAASVRLPAVPVVQPAVGYRDQMTPPSMPATPRGHGMNATPAEAPVAAVSGAPAVRARVEESSSPVPLIVHADEPSSVQRTDLAARIRAAAEQLRARADEITHDAQQAGQRASAAAGEARRAASEAQQLASRARRAADALDHAAEAMRALLAGDEPEARELLERAIASLD